MARIRSIKPDFFLDEDICALPFAHRLAFQGLWCEADREGRLEDRPKRLKATIFPYDDLDMDRILADLSERFITRYVSGGKNYIQINNFAKHQRPHHTEAPSQIPPLTEDCTVIGAGLTVSSPLSHGEYPAGREGKGYGKGKVIGRERKGKEVEMEGSSSDERFEQFWDAFSYKKGREGALQSWRRIAMTDELFATILEGARREAANRQAVVARGLTPIYAQGWLTGKRWQDEHVEPHVMSRREMVNRSAVEGFLGGGA